jgi:hypothetical protein
MKDRYQMLIYVPECAFLHGRAFGRLARWPASSLLALEVDSVLVLCDRLCQSRPSVLFTWGENPFKGFGTDNE